MLHAASQGAKPAIIFEGRTINWRQLAQAVKNAGAFFEQRLGREKQQIISILQTNSIDFAITYLGILQAGHIALPLDPAYKKLELDVIIEQLEPQLVVIEPRYLDQISHHGDRLLMIEELLKFRGEPTKPLRLPANQQIASLTFTSGTSGTPKAVPNTHANQIWSIQTCSKVWDWTTNDSLLINLPLSRWYGLVMGLTAAVYHGNTLHLMQQSFEAAKTLELLGSGQVSIYTHTPLGYIKLLGEAGRKDYDLSRVRLCISGSAPLPPPIWYEFKNRFGIEIIETYGSSETGRIAANRPQKKVLGSPGHVLPDVDLKLGPGGEVQIKSGGVFPGYWHNTEATAAATTADGYWRTGDIAEVKDGVVYLKGRVQEKIRRFGYNISPRDIEWAMHQNPLIREIYVMGIQNSSANDKLVYFIVSPLSHQQIEDYCKQNLLFAWRPDQIVLLGEIPRNSNGKPRMGKLRELVA